MQTPAPPGLTALRPAAEMQGLLVLLTADRPRGSRRNAIKPLFSLLHWENYMGSRQVSLQGGGFQGSTLGHGPRGAGFILFESDFSLGGGEKNPDK